MTTDETITDLDAREIVDWITIQDGTGPGTEEASQAEYEQISKLIQAGEQRRQAIVIFKIP
jgi:hypothetical protein